MQLKGASIVSGAAIGVLLAAGCAPTQAVKSAPTTAGTTHVGTAPSGTVLLSGSPGVPVVNPVTGTLYIPIQCPTSDCLSDSNVLDVINAAKCNAQVASGCRVIAKAAVGYSPLAAAVDDASDTIYVANGTGSVSVVNGARCNATVTSGCGKPVATIDVGGVAAAFDPLTRTLYVADAGRGIRVIDGVTCNAVTTTGCAQPAQLVPDNDGPNAVDVDVATDTVYAANDGTGGGDTVSVIDGATCNGSDSSGCGQTPRTIKVGSGAFWDAVDQATDTVYVTNNNDGTVSVIDGAECNATITTGCASIPRAVPTGAAAAGVAVDDALHTVFAVSSDDDTLSAINTSTCNGAATSGCPTLAPSRQAGPNQGAGYNAFPTAVALDPQTKTAYLVSIGGSNVLAVVTLNSCNATDTSGCRVETASVPDPEFEATMDAATDTIYASNRTLPEIDVLDGATCVAANLSGCAPVAEIPMGHPMAALGAIDDATRTLYASDSSGSTASVINIATCNAGDTATCSHHPPTITVGESPGPPVFSAATRTLYLPFGTSANEVAVVNAATCNAEITSGCGQTPGSVNVGEGTDNLSVSAKTDTIYAPSVGIPFATGTTVSVINGATCNGTNQSGCGHVAATVTVGLGPYGVAVDDATNTVYVANNRDGDTPGTVSVIDGATCNGSDTTGCAGPIPAVVIGRSPRLAVLDPSTNVVYITDKSSAAVSALNGATCNAAVMTGCSTPVPLYPVGSLPIGLAVNPETNTVYAMTFLVVGSMSIFGGRP